jgi:hypothetical protein
MPKGTRTEWDKPPSGPKRKEQKKRKAEDKMYERNKDKLEAARRAAKSDPELRKALAAEDAAWKAYSKSPKGLDERGDMDLYKKYQQAARKRVQIAQKAITSFSKGGMMNKKPMNKGMAALKKAAPAVAKKMGYKHGGKVHKTGYNKGGMAKCGASYKG